MLGTLIRASVAQVWADPAFPWSTFSVNVVGAFALGLLAGSLSKRPDALLTNLVATGVLGALTTFSTFAIEAIDLAQSSGLAAGVAYAGLSVGLGLGLAAFGYRRGTR